MHEIKKSSTKQKRIYMKTTFNFYFLNNMHFNSYPKFSNPRSMDQKEKNQENIRNLLSSFLAKDRNCSGKRITFHCSSLLYFGVGAAISLQGTWHALQLPFSCLVSPHDNDYLKISHYFSYALWHEDNLRLQLV